ncbi:hypothetical protein Tco_1137925, partial [Tanacetum coccineum]
FVQAIKIFFTHQANLNTPIKKSTPRVISYYQFTKLIIYYLGSRYNIHRRHAIHVTGDDFLLGNLKFVPKGEKDELVDEPDKEPQPAPEPQIEDDEYNLQRVCDTPSPLDAETGAEAEISDSEGDTEILNVGEEKGHKSLKHTTDEHVFLENPPSSSGTLSSMKNLDDAFTYGDQFLYNKSTEEEPDKANVETKVKSMVSVPIHQASSTAPPLSTLVIDLTQPKLKNKQQDQTSQALSSRIFTLKNHDLYSKIDKYINENVKEAVQDTLKALVRKRFGELIEFEMKEILRDRMFKSGSYLSQPEHTANLKLRRPQPGRLLTQEKHLLAPQSKRLALNLNSLSTLEPDWAIPLNDLPEPENNWANVLAKSYQDPEENKLLRKTSDMGSFIKWYCNQIGKKKLNKADLEGPTFKIDLENPEGHRVVPDVSKPLPLGGPPGQVTIQQQYFFNKDLEYLVSGDKDKRNALSVSKLKVAYSSYFGLEELVPSLWIESERVYDISAAYGISHWWFKHKEFYITRHSAPSDRQLIAKNTRSQKLTSKT